jgi:hypothetical protein
MIFFTNSLRTLRLCGKKVFLAVSEQNNGEENSSPHVNNAIYAKKGQ